MDEGGVGEGRTLMLKKAVEVGPENEGGGNRGDNGKGEVGKW